MAIPPKILNFAGSNRAESYNKKLAKNAAIAHKLLVLKSLINNQGVRAI
jgi:hypothetical protein